MDLVVGVRVLGLIGVAPGAGRGTVRLSAERSTGFVELHVTDEGRGFPPDFLRAAFERFSRSPHNQVPGGTGLGLAIAQAHGGKAYVGNRPGGGGDVWLALPATPGPHAVDAVVLEGVT